MLSLSDLDSQAKEVILIWTSSLLTVLLETCLCFLMASGIKANIPSMTSMALPFHPSSLINVYRLCIPAHKLSWCSMVPCFLCCGAYGLMISLLGIPLVIQTSVTNSTEMSSFDSLVKLCPFVISSVLLRNTHLSFNFKCICLRFWLMLIVTSELWVPWKQRLSLLLFPV